MDQVISLSDIFISPLEDMYATTLAQSIEPKHYVLMPEPVISLPSCWARICIVF